MNSFRATIVLTALVALVPCSACRFLKGKKTSDAGSDAATVAAARCFDLPGARRDSLYASEDGKSLFYTEHVRGDGKARVDFFQVAIDTGKVTSVASGVGNNIAPAGKGRWVFTRIKGDRDREVLNEYELHVVDPNGSDRAIGPAKLRSDRFVVDVANESVYTSGGLESLRRIPLAGGEGTEAKAMLGVLWAVDPVGKSLIARRAFSGGTCRLPLDALDGDCAVIGPDGYNLSLVQGGAIFYAKDDKETVHTPLGSKLDGTKDPLSLAWSIKGDRILDGGSPGAFVYVARSEEKATKLFRAGLDKADLVFQSNDVKLIAALPVGAQTAVLVEQANPDEEVDVCLVPATTTVTFPTRAYAKELAPAVDKTKPLLAGDLADAKIETVTRKYPLLHITATGAGPTDVDAFRTRVKDLQAKVTQATGMPNLGLRILYEGNSREAISEWREGGDKFYVGVGDKGKLLFDRAQFDVELDPKTMWKFSNESGHKFGSYDCNGVVKNIGPKPLALTVVCSVDTKYLGEQSRKEPIKPSPLLPGASAKYSFYAGSGDEDANVQFTVLAFDKPIPFFNSFAERKALGKEK